MGRPATEMHLQRSPPAALLVLAVVAASDGATTPSGGMPASAFQGPTWAAVLVVGGQPQPNAQPTITFMADRVKGTGGCNTFGGGYRYDESTGRITFGQLAMTMMACLDNRRMVVESAFLGAVNVADHLPLDGHGQLHPTGPGGEVVFTKLSGS
jgi:heat shock protein HslJ